MRRFGWVRVVVVLGLAGALVGVVPDGVSAVAARKECRSTAFVGNAQSGTVSTIDVKTRRKNPTDIPVDTNPGVGVGAVTPDGKTVFVGTFFSGTVSTIDVKTRTKNPIDIPIGAPPVDMAVTPDGKTAFVTHRAPNTV
jgi:YVTN family beta-propeller protein